MELKRDIYGDLLKWKQKSRKVLELKGARQTGKTFILDKFGRENYTVYIYINMAQTTGQEFLACLDQAGKWETGEPRPTDPIYRALKLFDPRFDDTTETLVVIDEIQESARVYSLICQFSRDFKCCFVVTGSYLGKTMEKEYFLSDGDTVELCMDTLSFEEFLEAFGKRELYETVDLYGQSPQNWYDELKSFYQIYCAIGGYPDVVNTYLESRDLTDCERTLYQVIRIFIEESSRYFTNVLSMNLFEQLFPAIAQLSVREKSGSGDIIDKLSELVYHEESNRVTKQNINYAVAWLYHSDIIDFCEKTVECNPMATRLNARIYFRDLGVARYFLKKGGVRGRAADEYINENFVYLALLKRSERIKEGK